MVAASWLLQTIYLSLLNQSTLKPQKTSSDSSNPIFVTTQTSYGGLKGLRRMTATRISMDTYFGIPFALPPVGRLRFATLEPPVNWSGIRDATNFRNECLQRKYPHYTPPSIDGSPIDQSEDCLYLNIYAPADAKTAKPLAVMVWIHGGGFVLGAGSQYDASELAATGVIVVTINYRLDVFGFLSNEGDEIPGNFGMLDQIMALKWVKENIQSFGGNPDQVTIFGESAGSASVSLLVLSPLAKGLFKRAIMESGVSLSPWAVSVPASRIAPKTMFTVIGNSVGCTDSDLTTTLQCLRNIDAHLLLNASVSAENIYPSSSMYGVRVENIFSFLPDLPINLLLNNSFNHVDTIHGFNTDESGEVIAYADNNGQFSQMEFAKVLKNIFEPYVLSDKDALIKEIITSYVGNKTNETDAIRHAAVKAISDHEFIGPTVIEVGIQANLAKEKKHFMYEFQYKPSFSSYPSWLKALHGDELPYVFGVNLPQFLRTYSKAPSKGDNVVWNQMKIFWSNFAKYGNPTQTIPPGAVNWTPYANQDAKYMKIDETSQLLSYKNVLAVILAEKVSQKLQASTSK